MNFANVDRWPQQPGAEQALAHGSERGIERPKESDLISSVGKQWFHQLQVADGHCIEHQALLAVIESDSINMLEGATLGGADIMEDGARRRSGCGTAFESKALQREHAELIFNQRNSVIDGKDPIF